MWLLTIKDKQNEGAYAVPDEYGDKVLFLFEKEDDAERYAMMINEQDVKRQMDIIEVEDELALKTCKMYNYKYAVITPNDFVIPPKNDNISED